MFRFENCVSVYPDLLKRLDEEKSILLKFDLSSKDTNVDDGHQWSFYDGKKAKYLNYNTNAMFCFSYDTLPP